MIPAFLARWPAVEIEARFVAGRTDPKRDDFDLTLRVGAAPPEDAYALHLGRAEIVLCASPAWLADHAGPSTPNQLHAQPTLVYGLDQGPWVFTGPGGVVTVDVRPRLRGDSADLLVAACRAGLGVLRIPEMAITDALRDGTLRRVLPDWTLPGADVWAIYGHRTHGDPTLAAFLDALRGAAWGAPPDTRRAAG